MQPSCYPHSGRPASRNWLSSVFNAGGMTIPGDIFTLRDPTTGSANDKSNSHSNSEHGIGAELSGSVGSVHVNLCLSLP